MDQIIILFLFYRLKLFFLKSLKKIMKFDNEEWSKN